MVRRKLKDVSERTDKSIRTQKTVRPNLEHKVIRLNDKTRDRFGTLEVMRDAADAEWDC